MTAAIQRILSGRPDTETIVMAVHADLQLSPPKKHSRSTGVALFVGDWAVAQLWLFWVAPIVGALIGAVVYRFMGSTED